MKNNIFLKNNEKEKVKKNLIINFRNCSNVYSNSQQIEIKKYIVEKKFSSLNFLWQGAIGIFMVFFIYGYKIKKILLFVHIKKYKIY